MKKLILVVCLMYVNSVFACNTSVLSDGVIYVGPGAKRNLQPEVSTIQEAVDIVQDCEFLISTFNVPADAKVNVVNGSNVISNINSLTTPWVGGTKELYPTDLIKISPSGKWYEIKSISNDEIITTRAIEESSGTYSYQTSITPSIQVFTRATGLPRPIYQGTVDLKDIHFLELRADGTNGLAMLVSSSKAVLSSPNAPSYGHLRLERLEMTGGIGGQIYLGNPVDLSVLDLEHDIDLTMNKMQIISTVGFDGIKSNYHGDIEINSSNFYSVNDLAFFPYTNSFLPPRSVLINDSSFVTGSTIIQTNKILTIKGRSDGLYTISNSLVSTSMKPNKQGGKAIKFTTNNTGTLTINNSRVVCTGCNTTTGAIVSGGVGTSVFVNDSEVIVSPKDCAFYTENDGGVIVSNSSVSRDVLGQITICSDGSGTVSVN